MTSPAAREHQQDRARLGDATARAAVQVWQSTSPDDIRASWSEQVLAVIAMLAGAQTTAAQQTEPWLSQQLGSGSTGDRLVPGAFAGHASDGRPLLGLLMYPAWVFLAGLTRGLSMPQAFASGAAFLDLLVRTQVADAGRAADSVGMASRFEVYGHERVVGLPACGRCLVLAGRVYRWTDEFQRHPRCDCTMEPVTYDEWRNGRAGNNPRALFDQMSDEQLRKSFAAADIQAIRDGADVSQVVNARRGMTTATAYGQQVQATTEGTTRRATFGRYEINEDGSLRERAGSELTRRPGERLRSAKAPRLMPAEIYARADDRDHAVRLLRKYGYLTGR